jgi:hypothetical protein
MSYLELAVFGLAIVIAKATLFVAVHQPPLF